MKIEYILLAVLIVVTAIIAAMIGYAVRNTERASSFVGYSQSCWQIGDTLHVVTAKGDTVRLDVSRLEEKQ